MENYTDAIRILQELQKIIDHKIIKIRNHEQLKILNTMRGLPYTPTPLTKKDKQELQKVMKLIQL